MSGDSDSGGSGLSRLGEESVDHDSGVVDRTHRGYPVTPGDPEASCSSGGVSGDRDNIPPPLTPYLTSRSRPRVLGPVLSQRSRLTQVDSRPLSGGYLPPSARHRFVSREKVPVTGTWTSRVSWPDASRRHPRPRRSTVTGASCRARRPPGRSAGRTLTGCRVGTTGRWTTRWSASYSTAAACCSPRGTISLTTEPLPRVTPLLGGYSRPLPTAS